MKLIKTIPVGITIAILLAGCASVAQKKDVAAVQTEVTQTKETITSEVRRLEADTNRRFTEMEKQQTDERVSFSERLENLTTETRTLNGKIQDAEFRLKETAAKDREEQERKNTEFRRDLESVKKSQNDLLGSLSSLSANLSQLQNDIISLKNTQAQLADAATKLTDALTQLEKSGGVPEAMEKKISILLDEIVRQESEMANAKLRLDIHERALVTAKILKKKKIPPPAPETDIHIVKKGETLSSIAKQYGMTTEQLKTLNNWKAPTVPTGRKLKVPKQPPSSPPAPPPAEKTPSETAPALPHT